MSGVYICGAASILTDRVIVTGQTPASEEHVDGIVAGGFSGAGFIHPAMTRRVVSITRAAGIARRGGMLCWFFFDIGYLIIGNYYSPNRKSTR
jgi:hypothetical protein